MTNKDPESPNRRDTARRRILKRLVAGGGIIATGRMMPDDWHKPVVESVILPAHAQTTQEEPPPLSNVSNVNVTMQMNFFGSDTDVA